MTIPIPAQGAGRIRWEPLLGGNFDGYVGTRAEPVFRLFLATPGTPMPWALRSARLAGYSTGTHPDDLKTEAERWLEEFVSSLGASFPAGPVVSRCECGGLASHRHGCRWRQGYGSLIESVLEECQP